MLLTGRSTMIRIPEADKSKRGLSAHWMIRLGLLFAVLAGVVIYMFVFPGGPPKVPGHQGEVIRLSVKPNGTIYLGLDEMDRSKLGKALDDFAQAARQPIVSLAGDRNADAATMLYLFHRLGQRGLDRVQIRTADREDLIVTLAPMPAEAYAPEPRVVRMELNEGGHVFVNREAMADDPAAAKKAHALLTELKLDTLVLQVEGRCPWAWVVALVSRMEKQGVKRFCFRPLFQQEIVEPFVPPLYTGTVDTTQPWLSPYANATDEGATGSDPDSAASTAPQRIATVAAAPANAYPIRHLDAGPSPARWVYPDGWWLLGPLPIDQHIPVTPRPSVDLAFADSEKRPVGWSYVIANTPRFRAIHQGGGSWYAMTTLRCDAPRTLALAAGDDTQAVWIDGKPVRPLPGLPEGVAPFDNVPDAYRIQLKPGVHTIIVRFARDEAVQTPDPDATDANRPEFWFALLTPTG